MSFKRTVKVPLITAAVRNAFEQMVPNSGAFVSIPLIENEREAVKQAKLICEKSLVKYEYIKGVENVEDTYEGWTVQFLICGD